MGIMNLIFFVLFILLGVNLLGKYGVQFGINRKLQKKIAVIVLLALLGLIIYGFRDNIFMLWVSICVATTIYIIYRSAKKSNTQQNTSSQGDSPGKIPKDNRLIISIHLDGGSNFENGETLEVTKGLMLYQTLDTGSKVITKEWDYDFWQITSNRSKHCFEWIREDHNANNVPTLRFWNNAGDENELRKNISEDMAIDIILDSSWMPEIKTITDAIKIVNEAGGKDKSSADLEETGHSGISDFSAEGVADQIKANADKLRSLGDDEYAEAKEWED